ncbi:MAG: helix-turn-helix domain-containing protein [Lachnospiraceae bacterium]|nr:helix-turn-helix domain-containing protein [Lachnospiraceae bacterium]
MLYNADVLKKQYKKACLEQRKKNLIRLREEIAGLSQTEFSKQTGIQKPNLSCLESGNRDMSLFNIQVYKTYFLENHKLNVSTDYLLGYTSVISNAEMNISNELGLSGKSIEVLKSWNELKKNPKKFAVAYGVTDIDTLNLMLEDYHYLQSKAKKTNNYAGFSIFHYIGNYIFSEHFRKCPQNKIMYKYKPSNSESEWVRTDLNKGDIVKANNDERTILDIDTYDKCNNGNNGTITIYNIENEDELYAVKFQDMLNAYDKENILTIIDRIKERINKKKGTA